MARQIESKYAISSKPILGFKSRTRETVLSLMGKCKEHVRLPLVVPDAKYTCTPGTLWPEIFGLLKCVPAGQLELTASRLAAATCLQNDLIRSD